MYFGWTETSKLSYAYELHHVLLISHNSDTQTQAWLEPPNHLIHYGKTCVNHSPLEWLVVMHIIFDKNTGGKTSKIKWLFALNLILSILKALQDLGSMRLTPGLQLQKQLNYTKCLVPDVASNAPNRALKTRKMDLNRRYGPCHI